MPGIQEIDEFQKEWFQELTLRNVELLKKIEKQQNSIYILHNKLQDNRTSDNQFRGETDDDQIEEWKKNVNETLKEIEENRAYMCGMLEFFRQSFFTLLDKTNQLKKTYLQNLKKSTEIGSDILCATIKECEFQLQQEYKNRYQATINKMQAEIKRKDNDLKRTKESCHTLQKKLVTQKCKFNESSQEYKEKIRNLEQQIVRLKLKNKSK